MKHLFVFLSLFMLTLIQGQTPQNDSIYFWKSGLFIERISIKNADLDSITFKRPAVEFPRVRICTQVWMIKNLDVTTYSDGTSIPNVTDANAWLNLTTGAWCYYDNNQANAGYGKLYNWYAVAGIYDAASLANPALRKKLAPTGWHVPSDAEWTTLTTCSASSYGSFGSLMDRFSWKYWFGAGTPSNSTGFTALPGGLRSGDVFEGNYTSGNWWSSSEYNTIYARWRRMIYTTDSVYSNVNNKSWGFSVRCLRD